MSKRCQQPQAHPARCGCEQVIKKCAACRTEKPVSEMKTCMHSQMHYYVCDSKCMDAFYSPPKQLSELERIKADYAALRAECERLQSLNRRLDKSLEAATEHAYELVGERTALESRLDAALAVLSAIKAHKPACELREDVSELGRYEYFEIFEHIPVGTKLYMLPSAS